MPSKYTRGWLDYGKEYSSMSVFMADVVEADYAETLTAISVFSASLDAITLGNPARESFKVIDDEISKLPAGGAFAQRETKWMVRYVDATTGKAHTCEIPTADLALLVPNTEMMNISSGAGATFKAQFELLVKTEEGNDVTVTEVEYVSRDL
jgi:hypothetical protein